MPLIISRPLLSLPTPWDLSGFSYDGVSFPVSDQTGITSTAIAFKPDGTKMYVASASSGGSSIYQYGLTSAWNLNTASYDSVFYSVAAKDTTPVGLTFKPDGSQMYINGAITDHLHQYTLSPNWDITSATWLGQRDVNPPNPSTSGIEFKPDGTKLFFTGSSASSDYVIEYDLPNPWNISTAVYNFNFKYVGTQDTLPRGVRLSDDGTKMFICGQTSDSVIQYTLSSAYDVTSASYNGISLDVLSQAENPYSLAFKTDGLRLFVLGSLSDTVYQYSSS